MDSRFRGNDSVIDLDNNGYDDKGSDEEGSQKDRPR